MTSYTPRYRASIAFDQHGLPCLPAAGERGAEGVASSRLVPRSNLVIWPTP